MGRRVVLDKVKNCDKADVSDVDYQPKKTDLKKTYYLNWLRPL